MEPLGQLGDELAHAETLEPVGRDRLHAVVGNGELPTDGGGGIGVVAQVGRQQNCLLEVIGVGETPQRRLEALDDKTRTTDLVGGSRPMFAAGDRLDGG